MRFLLLVLTCLSFLPCLSQRHGNYLIVVRESLAREKDWQEVIHVLQERHQASVCYYFNHPSELKSDFQLLLPRYVAVVDEAQNLTEDFIVMMNKFSRSVDTDIYFDFIWGAITGYDAQAALKLCHDSGKMLEIGKVMEVMDDHNALNRGENFEDFLQVKFGQVLKMNRVQKDETGLIETMPKEKNTDLFFYYFQDFLPECLISSFVFMDGVFCPTLARSGDQYFTAENQRFVIGEFGKNNTREIPLDTKGTYRVHLALGSRGADTWMKERSTALAWMKNGNVAGMLAYCSPVLVQRVGWSTLKNWMGASRYTFAEAMFLAKQQVIYEENDYTPGLLNCECQTEELLKRRDQIKHSLRDKLGCVVSDNCLHVLHERDRVIYFGDPKWDAHLVPSKEGSNYTVSMKKRKNKRVLKISTTSRFDQDEISGFGFRENFGEFEEVRTIPSIPFTYIFPTRLKNPKIAGGKWFGMVDENCIMLYGARLEPGKNYKVVIDVDQ